MVYTTYVKFRRFEYESLKLGETNFISFYLNGSDGVNPFEYDGAVLIHLR